MNKMQRGTIGLEKTFGDSFYFCSFLLVMLVREISYGKGFESGKKTVTPFH